MSDASQDGKSASWFASLRRPDTSDLSAESLAPLMNLTFERHRFGVAVMPVDGLQLFANYKRAARLPSLMEATSGFFYIANPDLVERFRRGAPLNQPDYERLYVGEAKGYTDYPFLPA